jgi:hypothetical protein
MMAAGRCNSALDGYSENCPDMLELLVNIISLQTEVGRPDVNAYPLFPIPGRLVTTPIEDRRSKTFPAMGPCFGEALDIAFRLLDDLRVKKALRAATDPVTLVVSGDIYGSVVRHGYDGIDQRAFCPLGRVQVAGNRYQGGLTFPEHPSSII